MIASTLRVLAFSVLAFTATQAVAVAPLMESEPNNNFNTADYIGSLGQIGDTTSVTGGFGGGAGGTSNDYFKFFVTSPLTIKVSFDSVLKNNGVAPVLSIYSTFPTTPIYSGGSGPYTFRGVAGGLYFASLSGGFKSTYTLTVAAVPEPETYAMMLAGLGLVGAIARRKKQSAQEAIAA